MTKQEQHERAIRSIAKVTDYAGVDVRRVYIWIGDLARAVERGDVEVQERLYAEGRRPGERDVVDIANIPQSEAMAHLGISKPTLIRWRKSGVIASVKRGGRYFYTMGELERVKRGIPTRKCEVAATLREREVDALERIADALEKIANA